MRSASEFRQMARETLRGNWKLAMGTGLVASLIGAEIADTAPNGISELQKVVQARPEVKNVLTQVFPMRSMLLPWVLLLIFPVFADHRWRGDGICARLLYILLDLPVFRSGFHKDVQLCDDTTCADGTSRIFRQRGDHRVAPPDGWEKMEFILPDL